MTQHDPTTYFSDGYLLILNIHEHIKTILIYKKERDSIKCVLGEYTDVYNNKVVLYTINPAICKFYPISEVIANSNSLFFRLTDAEVLVHIVIPAL